MGKLLCLCSHAGGGGGMGIGGCGVACVPDGTTIAGSQLQQLRLWDARCFNFKFKPCLCCSNLSQPMSNQSTIVAASRPPCCSSCACGTRGARACRPARRRSQRCWLRVTRSWRAPRPLSRTQRCAPQAGPGPVAAWGCVGTMQPGCCAHWGRCSQSAAPTGDHASQSAAPTRGASRSEVDCTPALPTTPRPAPHHPITASPHAQRPLQPRVVHAYIYNTYMCPAELHDLSSAPAPPPHAQRPPCTHAMYHARTHTHTYTHTHPQKYADELSTYTYS